MFFLDHLRDKHNTYWDIYQKKYICEELLPKVIWLFHSILFLIQSIQYLQYIPYRIFWDIQNHQLFLFCNRNHILDSYKQTHLVLLSFERNCRCLILFLYLLNKLKFYSSENKKRLSRAVQIGILSLINIYVFCRI